MGPGDAREERDERARAGIGAMEVLDDQQHRTPFSQPTEDTEDGLEETGLPSFRDDGRDGLRIVTATVDSVGEFRDEANDLAGGGAEHRPELLVGQRHEHRAEGPDDRLVRRVGPRAVSGAAHHGHRLLQAGHATDGLVDEPARADAGGPVDQQRP